MKMIVGLGNPGKPYEHTRHNIGFEVIDLLADKLGISVNINRSRGLTGQGMLSGEKVMLVKPLTYMNLSGECVGPLAAYYKLSAEDVIVISDDVNLPLGQLRIRQGGSAGGHNGLKNIIQQLGSDRFIRIRCGCGMKPPEMDLADYVLSHLSAEDRRIMDSEQKAARDAVICCLEKGIGAAMNDFNQRISKNGEEH